MANTVTRITSKQEIVNRITELQHEIAHAINFFQQDTDLQVINVNLKVVDKTYSDEGNVLVTVDLSLHR